MLGFPKFIENAKILTFGTFFGTSFCQFSAISYSSPLLSLLPIRRWTRVAGGPISRPNLRFFGRIQTYLAEKKNLRPEAENGKYGADLAEFWQDLAEIGRIKSLTKYTKNVKFFSAPQKCKFSLKKVRQFLVVSVNFSEVPDPPNFWSLLEINFFDFFFRWPENLWIKME